MLDEKHQLTGHAYSLWTSSHCGQCVVHFFRNLGDASIDWERWRALLVTPVGDRAMRLSQTHETNWREAHYISTVDLSSTFPAELPPDALLCSECPHESVRVLTSEKAKQAHRARAHGHTVMTRDFVSDELCPPCGKVFGSRPMATGHLQCRAQRCRRKMLDGLPPRLSAAVIATADDHDRTASLTKCTKSRFSRLTAQCTLVISVLCHSCRVPTCGISQVLRTCLQSAHCGCGSMCSM